MEHIGVTGARKVSREEEEQIKAELWELDRQATHWHIGDAEGVDRLARQNVTSDQTHYQAEGKKAWQLARRSSDLVRKLAETGGTLHAWANKDAPEGLKPAKRWVSAKGSGTWGTVALAVGLGVKVEMHWLGEERLKPDWL